MRVAKLFTTYTDGTSEVTHVAVDDEASAEAILAFMAPGFDKGYILLERVNEHDVTDSYFTVLNLSHVRGISVLGVEDVDTGDEVR